MADKIKIIVEKLIKAGVDMNTFLKASGSSIQEKIAEISQLYTDRVKKPKHKRKMAKY
ncbi:MAG: hypothetical protein NMK33_06140 (plasmid) [Candidatus Cardinium sp.]|uniref:hypothetical protein n=1 Tax=Cardinium endosymbiont of Dermatophagoides farinae TaxID=2597823 RepID=UPI00164292BC|nr:hypothetical protein [Cardinium endosymbiont of Dermatophagoides farinae]UWW97532.1 MAG: hypothetical protein NMK33_06290 [Candidatus Cardinium sp.]UWW97564.1 MAG: hypothetical protein NMK33_06470 [Candidatus Cardinium sp.]UWW97627.1 MAG: hypothetical protein NMK33_06140 [Candidatus Cardinium sp.]